VSEYPAEIQSPGDALVAPSIEPEMDGGVAPDGEARTRSAATVATTTPSGLASCRNEPMVPMALGVVGIGNG